MKTLCALLFALAAPAFAGDVNIAVKGTQPVDLGTVLVYLKTQGKVRLTPPKDPVLLSQKGANFTPRALVVVVGTRVDMTNDDFMLHDVFSDSEAKSFDTGHYPNGTRRIVTFDSVGRVDVHCRIHPTMNGLILVVDTPFFGVADELGRLILHRVPVGSYEVHAVRLQGPERVSPLTVRSDAPTALEL